MEEKRCARFLLLAAFGQGFYYVLSGLWSLVSIATFQVVTGPKTDIWLVKTVGSLLVCSGGVMLYSAFRRHVPMETILLALGNAAALIIIEIVYTSTGRISKVYLLDTGVEVVFIVLWLLGLSCLLDGDRARS